MSRPLMRGQVLPGTEDLPPKPAALATLPAPLLFAVLTLFLPSDCLSARMISVDLGYVSTTSPSFESGFTYGLGVTEGRGKIGFGITAMRFSNTVPRELAGLGPDGKPIKSEFDETVHDFYITFLATYHLNSPEMKNHMILGMGPQVHFVNSRLENPSIKFTARDYRLGIGGFFRYHRRIEMFGRTALVVTATYGHMQSVASTTDQYEPPTHSMNFGTITAGLAFPF